MVMSMLIINPGHRSDLDLLRQQAPLGEVVHEALGDAFAQLQRRLGLLALLVIGGRGHGQVAVDLVVVIVAAISERWTQPTVPSNRNPSLLG